MTLFLKIGWAPFHPVVDHVLHEARRLMGEGWCNSMYNLGDVIHEIGHVIGMNHEHHDGVIQGMIFGMEQGAIV